MSGHSKWSTIKRQKGANDLKRGQQFTKLSMAVTIAVREGGGVTDPNGNFRLRLAIEAARAANMPKENVERAIAKAAGPDAAIMEEVIYEGFAPHGVSVIVEAVTDNKNRTTPEIKSMFDKNGGTLGNPGSVSYQFNQIGQIIVKKKNKSFDDIFLLVAETGAQNVEEIGEEVIISTSPDELAKIREAVLSMELYIESSEIIRKPITEVILSDTAAEKVMQFLEKLDDHGDVQKVFANVVVSDVVA